LLPNPVEAHDTKEDTVDGPPEILNENSTMMNGTSPTEMTETEFRVRRIQPSLWQCLPQRDKFQLGKHWPPPNRQFLGAGSSGKWHFCQSADALG
jgi:hypothetical protein